MFGIGLPEMILILALALIVVGPDKLPDLARSMAKGLMELKKTAEGLKQNLKDENPVEDIQSDLEDAANTLRGHLLDHPEHGQSSLFPGDDQTSAKEAASQAYEELSQDGVNPASADTTADQSIEQKPDNPDEQDSSSAAVEPAADTTEDTKQDDTEPKDS